MEKKIQTTNFSKAKDKLKRFSEEIPNKVELPTVETDKWYLFDHQVTGKELNNITEKIQDCFISNNEKINKIIKEFGEVYNALEALDKDYIQSILISIKATGDISNEAKKIAENVERNNLDIKKTIEIQKKTLLSLTQFKSQINEYKNLANIDTMWHDFQLLKKEFSTSNTKLILIDQEIKKYTEDIKELNNKVKKTNIFFALLVFTNISLVIIIIIIILMNLI